MRTKLCPEILIKAYRSGFFPMAESRRGPIYWHSPDPRAIIPLDKIKMPRSLRKTIKTCGFTYSVDEDFRYIIEAASHRRSTWISDEIIVAYCELHRLGVAHSVETWMGDELVGGLYGLAIGGAFFGESMFNYIPAASKAAFYHLTERLIKCRFSLLDTQYINQFTQLLGAIEIPRDDYLILLDHAINLDVSFDIY